MSARSGPLPLPNSGLRSSTSRYTNDVLPWPEYGDLVALDVPRGELRVDSPAEGGIGAGQPVYKAFIFPERHNDLDDP